MHGRRMKVLQRQRQRPTSHVQHLPADKYDSVAYKIVKATHHLYLYKAEQSKINYSKAKGQ